MAIGGPITWNDFTSETKAYNTTLSAAISAAGVGATEYVMFTIDDLVNYLNSIRAVATEVNVNMSISTQTGSPKLSVIFTANGATPKDPKGTVPYDSGQGNP